MHFLIRIGIVSSFAVALLGSQIAQAAKWRALAISPDGAMLAAGGDGGEIRIWDANSGRPQQALSLPRTVNAITFVGDARTLAAGLDQGGVEVWRAGASGVYSRIQHLHEDQIVHCVSTLADGKILQAGCGSGWTYLTDTAAWKPVGILFERSNLTSGAAFSKDGSFIATAGNEFLIWNTGSDSAIWRDRPDTPVDRLDKTNRDSVRYHLPYELRDDPQTYKADIAISPDDKLVVGVNGTSRLDGGGLQLYAWDPATGKKVWHSFAKGLVTVTFTADGRHVITGSDDGAIRIWNSKSGKLESTIPHHTQAVRAIVPLKKTSHFAAASEDGAVTIWDADSATLVRPMKNASPR